MDHPACSAAFWQELVPCLGVSRRLERARVSCLPGGASIQGARQPSIDLSGAISFEERVGFVGTVVGVLSRSNVHFQHDDLIAARAMSRSVNSGAMLRSRPSREPGM